MLAAVPPSWMIPWTRASGRSCWRHSPTDAEQQDHRVEGVPALPRVGGRVRLEAVEDDVDVLRGERLRCRRGCDRRGGTAARRRGPSNRPSSIMNCLPLPRSSAGVPRKTISPGSSSAIDGEGDRGADPGRGHRVVAAAVAEPRAGRRTRRGSRSAAPSPPRPPRRVARIAVSRRPAGCSTSKPWPREDLRDPRRRLALLEGRLGVGVDPVRQLEDLVARRLDGRGEPALGVGVRARRGRTRVRPAGQGRTSGRRSALDRQASPRRRGRCARTNRAICGLEDPVEAEDDEDRDDEDRPSRRAGSPAASRHDTRSAGGGRRRPARTAGRRQARRRGRSGAPRRSRPPGRSIGSRVVTTSATRMQHDAAGRRRSRGSASGRALPSRSESRAFAVGAPGTAPRARRGGRSRGPARRRQSRSLEVGSGESCGRDRGRRPPASRPATRRRRRPPSRRRRGGSRRAPGRRAAAAASAKIAGCGLIVADPLADDDRPEVTAPSRPPPTYRSIVAASGQFDRIASVASRRPGARAVGPTAGSGGMTLDERAAVDLDRPARSRPAVD